MSAQPDDLPVAWLMVDVRDPRNRYVTLDYGNHHKDHAIIPLYAASRIERDAATIASRDAEIAALKQNYDDLIYAVAQKWPGESRHETAKRYIIERESRPSHTAQAARAAIPSPDGAAG